jgi:hypothetical protein
MDYTQRAVVEASGIASETYYQWQDNFHSEYSKLPGNRKYRYRGRKAALIT